MYSLGKNSKKNLLGVKMPIVQIVNRAIKLSNVDFGILKTGGFRTKEMQNQIFDNGYSKCDGIIKKSYHQSGKAVDLIPYINGGYTWGDKEAFIEIYKAWVLAEKELKIPDVFFHHGIFWRWDDINKNGVLDISDKLGWDAAHHEMRSKPQIIK